MGLAARLAVDAAALLGTAQSATPCENAAARVSALLLIEKWQHNLPCLADGGFRDMSALLVGGAVRTGLLVECDDRCP